MERSENELAAGPAPFLRPAIRWLVDVGPRWSKGRWIGVLSGAAAVLFVQWVVLLMLAFAKVDRDYLARGITDAGGVDGDTHAFMLSILWWSLLLALEIALLVTTVELRRRRRGRDM